MANAEQLSTIKWGSKAWNEWRQKNKDTDIELPKVDLHGIELEGAFLNRANLREANLSHALLGRARLMDADLWTADLSSADLRDANLRGANLRGANLELALLAGADLRHADLRGANLGWATLVEANLYGANLAGANMVEATLNETILSNVNLSGAQSLHEVVHLGPSSIDEASLLQSGKMPLPFLSGLGLSEAYLEYLPAIREASNAIQFFSCFIIHSIRDQKFVRQLQSDLREKGVRVWLEERGGRGTQIVEPPIDQRLRLWDKSLLCCSANAMEEGWIGKELEFAHAKEDQLMKEQGKEMRFLIPFSIDRAVFQVSNSTNEELKYRMGADFSTAPYGSGGYDGEVTKLSRWVRGY